MWFRLIRLCAVLVMASGQSLTIQPPENSKIIPGHFPDILNEPTPKQDTQNTDNTVSVDTTTGTSTFSDDEINTNDTEVEDDSNIVNTTHGLIKGYKWKENKNIIGYMDIPYGKVISPFQRASFTESWDLHDVKEHNKICPQIRNEEFIGDLDCLTLSIFTPAEAENVSVLFHIHDIHATSGDPSVYGPERLVTNGIILVLPNYRLGALGFLCLKNETAPGNAGLKDLAQALKWVTENIEIFGGNPSNIVVSGDGLAGALVGYLTLYSPSKDYISKAITESGSVLSPKLFDRNPLNTANQLANNIREAYPNNDTINDIIHDASLTSIVKAAKDLQFNPCLEADKEPFMEDTPWQVLNNNKIDTTFMIGSASFAGTHDAISVAIAPTYFDKLNVDFGLIFPDDLIFDNNEDRTNNALKIKNRYFGDGNITSDHLKELSLCLTDAYYLGPSIRVARPLARGGAKVYLYEFDFVGELNKELESINSPIERAVRSDIVGYIFKRQGSEVDNKSPENKMVDIMIHLWVSFINYGEPALEDTNWSELKHTDDAAEEEYLQIASEPKLKKGVHVDRLNIWTNLYQEHFIERNFTPPLKQHNYSAYINLITLLISFTKFNYGGHQKG